MSTTTGNQQAEVSTQKKTANVLVLDRLAERGLEALESAPNLAYEVRLGLAGAELRKALEGFDAAICRSGVQITAEVLDGLSSLKAIVRAGVGTDNIDKQAASAAGIVVMNTPDGNTVSTAELTMGLMLALARHIAPAYARLQAGEWDRKSFEGVQLSGKTLGVIGLGRIGIAVAQRAAAFGMRVVGYDPFTAVAGDDDGLERVASLDELWPQIDFLTVHTPLTDVTRGLVGENEIGRMKRGVRLINCARGGVYNEGALLAGLESGQLGGVALDVFETEPNTQSPLFGLPGVVCTPHLGASTVDAQVEVAVEAVNLLAEFFETGRAHNVVNA